MYNKDFDLALDLALCILFIWLVVKLFLYM